MCVAVLRGGLLSTTTESNLTPSLNHGDDRFKEKYAFASRLDIADIVNTGKNHATSWQKKMLPQKSISPQFSMRKHKMLQKRGSIQTVA